MSELQSQTSDEQEKVKEGGRYCGQDRRRQISFKDALLEYPQLRSLGSRVKSKRWCNEELLELNELLAIVRFQHENNFIPMRRLHFLCGKYRIRELPVVLPDRRNTLLEAGKRQPEQFLVSEIYSSPFCKK